MDKKVFVFIAFIAFSFILLAVAASLGGSIIYYPVKLVLLIAALLFDLLALSSRYYTYLILPMFRQMRRNVVLNKERAYTLSASEDAVIQKQEGDYLATVYVNIPLYRSATEMSDAERYDFTKQVSALVGISRDPVRFTTELYVMNKDSYIGSLRDTISSVENEQSTLILKKASQPEIDRVKGKLAMWRKMLENVSRESSLELGSFAALSARGSKEFEAVNMAQQKARELMSGIGTTFGISPNIITGKELLKLVEPEYLIPFSTVNAQISQKIEEEVI